MLGIEMFLLAGGTLAMFPGCVPILLLRKMRPNLHADALFLRLALRREEAVRPAPDGDYRPIGWNRVFPHVLEKVPGLL